MNSGRKITITLADDHNAVRQSFATSLSQVRGLKIIAQAANGKELLKTLESHLPDIVIIDLSMPIMNGMEALKKITCTYPSVRSIIFSMHLTDNLIFSALNNGASSYITKDCGFDEVVKTIKQVYTKGFYFNEDISNRIMASSFKKNGINSMIDKNILSERAQEVLKLLCEGKTNKTIAETLYITSDTVEYHRKIIYKKTGSKTIVDLIKFAIKTGVIFID